MLLKLAGWVEYANWTESNSFQKNTPQHKTKSFLYEILDYLANPQSTCSRVSKKYDIALLVTNKILHTLLLVTLCNVHVLAVKIVNYRYPLSSYSFLFMGYTGQKRPLNLTLSDWSLHGQFA